MRITPVWKLKVFLPDWQCFATRLVELIERQPGASEVSTHIINDVSGCGVGGGNLGDRGGAIDVMNYILGIFSLRSFKKNPIMVLKNSLLLAFRILTRSGSVITVEIRQHCIQI